MAHEVLSARFPVIDAHNHLRVADGRPLRRRSRTWCAMLDEVHVETVVNLSGGYGESLVQRSTTYDLAFPGRFATFCNVDWSEVGQPGLGGECLRTVATRRGGGGSRPEGVQEPGTRVPRFRGPVW